MSEASAVIGVDIGGTKIAAGIIPPNGMVTHVLTEPTPSGGAEAILQKTASLCSHLRVKADGDNITVRAIGIGAAGQIDHEHGAVLYANDNIPGWANTPVADWLSDTLRLPVVVDNDVNAMAFGESRVGAGVGYRHLLYVAVGTGIGGALVYEGLLWRGAHSSAGEIGYLIAGWDGETPVTIEQIASGPGLETNYFQLTGEKTSLRKIAQRAHQGEAAAIEVIRIGAYKLGKILGAAICLIDPEIVVVGGGVPGVGPLWWQSFEASLRDSPLTTPRQVKLAPAQFDINAVMIGAGLLAYQSIGER
ncbi:MAG: ROK family protein [Anaerolineae bacterium]|nr:ROK family protein [Anaerolineae bacterium]